MSNSKNYKAGLFSAIFCSTLWGVLPIYWNLLKPISSTVIIFYRIFLMWVLCLLFCGKRYGLKNVYTDMFKSRKDFFTYFFAGIVITFNWSVYIWAVNADHVLQTSMGYFLEPIVVCIFGIMIYKERANKYKKIAMIMAVIGLSIMITGYRQIPLIAVSLGISFAVYAAIKKSVDIHPLKSLLYETTFIAPLTFILIVMSESKGIGAFACKDPLKIALILLAGIMTAVPLALFSYAANNIPLVTLGICDYISPSIAMILGIFLFSEPFDLIQFSAFAVIWVGLVFFTVGEIKESQAVVKIHR